VKRVLAIHDISGVGKCSLTVALPIISACGVECAAAPTAVLSTHTGGFEGYTFRDLTDDLAPMFAHWDALGVKFDAAYSGYLGSARQIAIVEQAFSRVRDTGGVIIVDPVMADNGTLYASFPPDFPDGMRSLCERADIILPNMTESALMLGEAYVAGPYTREYVDGLLRRLAVLPRRVAVVTGVYFGDEQLGAAAIDRETGEISYALAPKIDGMYHGTGDVFASVFVGAYLRGLAVPRALQIAADFTSRTVLRTKLAGTEPRYGVAFEPELGALARELDL
jgi:pyridoxine kinase